MRDTVKETNKSKMGAELGGARGLSTLNLAGLIRRAAAGALEKPPWLHAQTDPATGAGVCVYVEGGDLGLDLKQG